MMKKLLSALAAIVVTAGIAQAVYIVSFDRLNPQGTAPVLSACGGATAGDTGSTDMAGTVTQGGTVTTCTITFGTAFVAVPTCLVSDLTGTRASMATTVTNAAVAVTGITASDKLAWWCVPKSGG